MIERVVLHQSRFRIPGLAPDARGIAMGPTGVVLLPSPERLVSFLRACGEEGALDELLDALRLLQVLTPLRTREMVVEVQSGSSHRMDRLAAIARLVGGFVFTGSGRHFVKYRDASAPFGYDSGELLAEPGDLALYHDRFSQPYRVERTLAIRDLILRLALVALPRARADGVRQLYALVAPGLGETVVSYLARWNAPARIALVEWPRGGTSDAIDRAYLLVLASPAPRFVQLLRSLPGITLFVPDGERTAVQLGHRHPIPLASCTPLFSSEELVLFRAGGAGAIVLPQRPPFVDVQAVTTLASTANSPVERVTVRVVEASFGLPLALVPSPSPPRRVSAAIVRAEERDLLGRLLALLPPSALSRLSAAFSESSIYLLATDGALSLPLGQLFEDVGERVYVPLGLTLSPPLPADVLRQLGRVPTEMRVFVTGGRTPLVAVPESAFVPATRLLVTDVAVYEDALIAPPIDGDRALPDLWPVPPGTLAGLTSPGARGSLPPPRALPPELALPAPQLEAEHVAHGATSATDDDAGEPLDLDEEARG